MWKRWKILQKYLEHCWKECVSLLKVLCRMLIELGHSICQSWFWERAKHRDTENVKNETRSARYLLREHWGASVFLESGRKDKNTKGESESAFSQFLDRCCNGWVYICAHPKHKAGVLRSHFAAKYLKYCDRKLDKTARWRVFFFHRSIVGEVQQQLAVKCSAMHWRVIECYLHCGGLQ